MTIVLYACILDLLPQIKGLEINKSKFAENLFNVDENKINVDFKYSVSG